MRTWAANVCRKRLLRDRRLRAIASVVPSHGKSFDRKDCVTMPADQFLSRETQSVLSDMRRLLTNDLVRTRGGGMTLYQFGERAKEVVRRIDDLQAQSEQ